jgi:hypothetical protein
VHPRASQTAFFIVVIVLLAGLLAGCGGGGESGGGSQDGGSEQQSGDGGSEQQKGDSGGSEGGSEEGAASQQVKIALGTIGSVTPEKNRFTLEPSTEEQGEKPIPFKVRKSTQITVAGEQAEIGALEEGAQANVNYITIEGKNRARSVEVIGQ